MPYQLRILGIQTKTKVVQTAPSINDEMLVFSPISKFEAIAASVNSGAIHVAI